MPLAEPGILQLAVWKEAVLKQAHAHFLRFRKPPTERIRELVIETVPHVKDIKYAVEGVQLYDTARKSFDNMRNDFMRGTRLLATMYEQQIRYGFTYISWINVWIDNL